MKRILASAALIALFILIAATVIAGLTGAPANILLALSVGVLVKTFNESSPVADNVTWTSELQMTGPITMEFVIEYMLKWGMNFE